MFKKLVASVMVALSLTSNFTTEVNEVKELNTIVETREEIREIESLKVTYLTFEEYGSEIVTNYIEKQEIEEVEGFEGVYTTLENSLTYADAELSEEVGYVVSYGWLWDIEEVTTEVTEVVEVTREIEENIVVTVLEVEGIEVINSNRINNIVDSSVAYMLDSSIVCNYVSVVLVSSRLERAREYKMKSLEDG